MCIYVYDHLINFDGGVTDHPNNLQDLEGSLIRSKATVNEFSNSESTSLVLLVNNNPSSGDSVFRSKIERVT